MIFIARASFPRAMIQQAVQVYICLTPLPQTVGITGPYFRIDEERSKILATAIYRFKEFTLDEARRMLDERYAGFREVDGFQWEIDCWRTVEETIDKLVT